MVGPHGAVLHRGQVGAKEAQSLGQSKLRTQLAKQLEQGHACVFVMLAGKDEKQNALAKKQLERVISEVKSGKISLYTPPGKGPKSKSDAELDDILSGKSPKKTAEDKKKDQPAADTKDKKDETKAKPKNEVSLVVVDRSSKEEMWFVRNLLSLEPDLKDLPEPMVFPVYGRARALLPMIGKGITYDLLVGSIEFVTGACSCEIKDQNPGIDLLVHYDWEAAAGKVAEKFGREEGNENRFRGDDLFPEILIPSAKADDPPATKSNAEGSPKDAPKNANPPVATDDNQNPQGTDNVAEVNPVSRKKADPTANEASATEKPAKQVASLEKPVEDADAPKATGDQARVSGVLIIGTGIGLALLLLMVATMVIMKPR